MKINKIILENYRSHIKSEYNFTSGINLILGENGKGKSSILEAIFSTLFSISTRDGKNKGNLDNIIRFGEKQSKIIIDFIANNNREYRVIRTINIEKKLKNKIEIIDKNSQTKVEEDLLELCGLENQNSDIFENIIVAKQNEFINTFKKTNSEKMKVFDKIFNTTIYKEMSDGFFKKSLDKYQKLSDELNTKLLIQNKNLIEPSILLQELEYKNNELINLTKNEDEIIKELKIVKEKKDCLYNLKKNINNIENNLKNKKNELILIKDNLKNIIKESKNSKNSLKIVKDNEENYFKYEKIENEKNILEDKIKKYINILNEIEKKEEKIKANNNLIAEKNKSISRFNNDLNVKIDEEKNAIQEFKKIDYEIIYLTNQEEEIKNILQKIENLCITEKEEKIKNILIEKEKNENNIKILEERYKVTFNNLENKFKKGEEFYREKKSEKDKLHKDIFNLEKHINDFKNYRDNLKEATCPFMKEKCNNIQEKQKDSKFNVSIFFNDKINEFEEELKLKKQYIEKVMKLLSKEEIYIIDKNNFNILKENTKKIREEYLKINSELEYLKVEENKLVEDIKKILLNLKFENIEDLYSKLIRLNEKKNNINIEKFSKYILSLKEQLKNIELEITNVKNDTLKITKEKAELSEFLKSLSINNIDDENFTLNNLKENLKNIEINKNNYLKNKNSADKLVENLNKFKNIKAKFYNERKNLKYLIKNLENEKNKFLAFNESEIEEKIQTYEEKHKFIFEQKGILKSNIDNLEKEINKNNNLKEELKSYEKEINIVNQKIDTVENIRKNLKDMGPKISAYKLDDISQKASINFNKITSRSEKILWTNEEDEKYSILLQDKDKKIHFEQLSGGEQVAVAIALRGVMLDYFTKSKFFILDEPTNNLDTDRKILLAEYIGEMLKNLDQTIIVSHDDVFSEMAENIIKL